jgi:hypothetical protein
MNAYHYWGSSLNKGNTTEFPLIKGVVVRSILSVYKLSPKVRGVMMKSKLWAVILIAIILGTGLPMESYAQEDFCRIIKLVRFRDGRLESIQLDTEKLVEIRDSRGRDRTPENGVIEGEKIASGLYVLCGKGISVALQTSNKEVFWVNSNTAVQVKDEYIWIDKGEIYTSAKAIRLKLTDEQRDWDVVGSPGDEFYLKAGQREPSFVYLFDGSIDIDSDVLNRRKPLAQIHAGQVRLHGLDDKDVNEEPILSIISQAEMWRKSIRRLTPPFWRKPKFYIPTAAIAAGITAAVYYLTREQEAEVRIHIEMP